MVSREKGKKKGTTPWSHPYSTTMKTQFIYEMLSVLLQNEHYVILFYASIIAVG